MATLFSKTRTFVLSNLHTLLDAAIDLNSIGAIKQHVRDLEQAKESLADEAAIANGRVSQVQREISDLKLRMEETDGNINLLLSDNDPTNDHLAEPLEQKLIGYENNLKAKEEELVGAEDIAQQLLAAATKLTARHAQMLQNLRRLESMERSSDAQDRATRALRGAAVGAGPSVDNVEQRLRDRSTASDARFKRALGSVSETADDAVLTAQAKQRIAERRKRLHPDSAAAE